MYAGICMCVWFFLCMCVCVCVCACVCVCVCKRESARERTRERKRERESQRASEREREREGESQREKTQYGFLATINLGTQCPWSVKISLYLSPTQTTRTFSHTREPARKDAKWRVRCNALQHTARLEWWGPWSIIASMACTCEPARTGTFAATHSNTLQHTATHFNIGMMRTWSINSKHGAHARACAKRRKMARSMLPTTALSSSVPCTVHSNRGVAGSVLDVRMYASIRLGGWLTNSLLPTIALCGLVPCTAHSNSRVGSVLDVRMRASIKWGGWLTKGAR